MLRALCFTLKIKKFRCHEVKIEENEKAGSRTQDTSGLNYIPVFDLPLSNDNQTTTNPHNPLYRCTDEARCSGHLEWTMPLSIWVPSWWTPSNCWPFYFPFHKHERSNTTQCLLPHPTMYVMRNFFKVTVSSYCSAHKMFQQTKTDKSYIQSWMSEELYSA